MMRSNRLDEVKQSLQSNRQFQASPDALLMEAQALRRGNPAHAESLLKRALQARTDSWTVFKMFEFYNSQKNTEQSHRFRSQLLSSIKQTARDFCAHGLAYLVLGDSQKAEAEFESALDKDPHCVDAIMGMAKVCADRNDPDGQLTWAQKALAECPHLHDALTTIAEVQIRAADYDKALETIQTLKSRCNPSAYASYLEGQCYNSKGEHLKARTLYFSIRTGKCIGANLDLQIGLTYLQEGLFKKVVWAARAE